MKTNWRPGALACALLILAASVPGMAAADSPPIEGRWLLDFESDGRVGLTLDRRNRRGGGSHSSSENRIEEFRGLSRPRDESELPARFELVRDAGTFAFEGRLDRTGGSGRFSFAVDPGFGDTLAGLGYRRLTAEESYAMALHDVGRKFVTDLAELGYRGLPVDDLLSMGIHGATPEFIRELEALGYRGLPVEDLVSMRIHDATPEFIRQMKALGYTPLPADELVSMRIHDVSPAFIGELRTLGYRNVAAEDLVSMRIHDVTPEFIQELQALGYRDVAVDELVSMKIHDVTPEFVRKMKAALPDATPEDLVQSRIRER